jgi:hypothetical protein
MWASGTFTEQAKWKCYLAHGVHSPWLWISTPISKTRQTIKPLIEVSYDRRNHSPVSNLFQGEFRAFCLNNDIPLRSISQSWMCSRSPPLVLARISAELEEYTLATKTESSHAINQNLLSPTNIAQKVVPTRRIRGCLRAFLEDRLPLF